ncbi:MAG: universal stress protein [Solirubrobacteraceae bacterium]|nr:universal stress protein [Solirubrobacteraceae bacterium]
MSSPILVAVTPGDHDRSALEVAIMMARLLPAPLLLGAVAVPAEIVPSSAMVGWVAEAVEPGWLGRSASQQLMQLAASLPDDVAVTTAVSIAHSISVGLEELAARSHASLIVVGPTHRTLGARVIDEDPTLGLVRHAPCAVLIVQGDDETPSPAAPPRRIVVAWDRSLEAHHALAYAADLAHKASATLEVIHVLEASPLPSLAPGISHGRLAERIASAEEEIRTALAAAEADAAEISVREGRLGPELARASAGADLLVVGSRRHGPVRRVVTGSASAYLAHHGRCPVLVTPRRVTSPAPA